MEKAEGTMKKSSQRKSEVPGKIELTGSLSDRLDALDKRETELMEENGKMSKEVARLKEDKSKLRQKLEELEWVFIDFIISAVLFNLDYLGTRTWNLSVNLESEKEINLTRVGIWILNQWLKMKSCQKVLRKRNVRQMKLWRELQ